MSIELVSWLERITSSHRAHGQLLSVSVFAFYLGQIQKAFCLLYFTSRTSMFIFFIPLLHSHFKYSQHTGKTVKAHLCAAHPLKFAFTAQNADSIVFVFFFVSALEFNLAYLFHSAACQKWA